MCNFFLEFLGDLSDILQEVHVPIVSDMECSENYGDIVVPDTNICAGIPEGGRDTCQGEILLDRMLKQVTWMKLNLRMN